MSFVPFVINYGTIVALGDRFLILVYLRFVISNVGVKSYIIVHALNSYRFIYVTYIIDFNRVLFMRLTIRTWTNHGGVSASWTF
jgi:hypothetical protein